jgi:hypothetical protein
MPVYFGLYKINANLPPSPNPSDGVKQLEAFAAALKMQMDSGDLKEVHEFVDADAGYFISGDISPERMHQNLTAWFPWVTFEVHQTVPTQTAIQHGLLAAKMRAGTR